MDKNRTSRYCSSCSLTIVAIGAEIAVLTVPTDDEKRATHGSGPDRSSVFYEVLTYLLEHPEAQDTLEGVVDWWVEKERVKQQTKKVQAALAELVALGFVRERVGRDGRVHYRVDQRKTGEMRKLFDQRPT